MRFDYNPHHHPVARELHEANAQLRGIGDQLWEMNQPPEVRAALQARRDDQARAMRWGLRLVFGLALVWVVLTTLFGRAGLRVFGGLLGLVWQGLEVALVLGFFYWIAHSAVRGARWLTGRSGGGR